MKRNDQGDFTIVYLEQDDTRGAFIQTLSSQQKPVVIMLGDQTRLFQRPEDFTDLKHARRQLDLSVIFIIAGSERLTQLASRNGFPVYASMDALAHALTIGLQPKQAGQRSRVRNTMPLTSSVTPLAADVSEPVPVHAAPRKTITLSLGEEDHAIDVAEQEVEAPIFYRRTAPLPSEVVAAHSEEPIIPAWVAEPEAGKDQRNGVIASEGVRRQSGSLRLPAPEAPSVVTPSSPTSPIPTRRTPPPASRTHPLNASERAQPPSLVASLHAPAPAQRTARRSSPPPAPPARTARKRAKFPIAMIGLLIFALLITGLGSILFFLHQSNIAAPVPPKLVGHVAFLSSEQLSENSSQGIDDQLLIDLSGLPNPAAHTSYYGWLLGDRNQSDARVITLGPLTLVNGRIHKLYAGDTQHTNLLLVTGRFLITEEDSQIPPIAPSPDQKRWRYYGEFSQTPINTPDNVKQFSYLDHLRHLLAADPTLDEMELPGGLNNWFYRNISKMLEWTTSMREPWEDSKDVGFVRRQTTRVLDYLDGASFVKQDLPGMPLLVNQRLAGVGLLEVNGPSQDPPAYFTHIVHHLNGLLQASQSGSSPQLRQMMADLLSALNNVQFWLEHLRSDAQQIMKMTDTQLRQPSTLNLLNDMVDNATKAYVGQQDPNTGQMRQGVNWLHSNMQNLATLDIFIYVGGVTPVQMIPNTQHMQAKQ